MERLRAKDAQAGIEYRPRTDAQKAEIADVRSLYESKLAQAELTHRSRVARLAEPESLRAAEAEYVLERQRLIEERDRKVEQIRSK